MNDLDKRLEKGLKTALYEREAGRTPAFENVWSAAEQRSVRQRRRRTAVAGVIAVAAVALLLRPADDLQYIDTNELLETTSWSAPSDSLLPERHFDLFEETPVLIESTDTYGGALL